MVIENHRSFFSNIEIFLVHPNLTHDIIRENRDQLTCRTFCFHQKNDLGLKNVENPCLKLKNKMQIC